MSINSTLLNYSFVAEQGARIAAGDRASEDIVAAQLKQTAEQTRFEVGSTITARYRYKVAEDGSFVPIQTQITTDAPNEDAASGNRGRLAQRQKDRAPTFRDYSQPKPQLSPSDEATIFSSLAQNAVPNFGLGNYAPKISVSINTNISAAEVLDESGNLVQAEVIAPKTEATVQEEKTNFSASFRRAQFSVASLYARSDASANQPLSTMQIAA